MDALCNIRLLLVKPFNRARRQKVIDVFQRTCSCLLDTWKEKNIEIGSYYFSFFALSNLLTQTCFNFCRTGQLTSFEHAKYTFIIYYYICLPLCAHMYFDAAKFSLKLFSLIYVTLDHKTSLKGDLLCKDHFYKVFEHSCVKKNSL